MCPSKLNLFFKILSKFDRINLKFWEVIDLDPKKNFCKFSKKGHKSTQALSICSRRYDKNNIKIYLGADFRDMLELSQSLLNDLLCTQDWNIIYLAMSQVFMYEMSAWIKIITDVSVVYYELYCEQYIQQYFNNHFKMIHSGIIYFEINDIIY